MIFFLYVIKLSVSSTIAYNFDAQISSVDASWFLQPSFSTCNAEQIFGGYNYLNKNQNLWNFQANLAPHYKIQVEIKLSRLGDWVGDSIQVQVDQIPQYQQYYFINNSTTTCNSMQYEEDQIIFVINHNFRSAHFAILPRLTTSDIMYWGIKNFKVSIYECEPNCNYCRFENDDCLWSLAFSSITKMDLNDQDGWTNQNVISFDWDTCCQWIYQPDNRVWKTFQLPEHDFIKVRFRNRDQYFRLIIDSEFVQCQIPQQSSICETESLQHTTSKVTIMLISLGEFGFRDIELFISKQKPYEQQLQCLQYVNSECIQCKEGWDFKSSSLKCLPICGDGLIRGQEECDYGVNGKSYPNCINCKYQCDPNCLNCIFGICYECNEGYYLNEKKICTQKCQVIFVKIQSNQEQYHYLNENFNTLDCFEQILKCDQGWIIDPIQEQCEPICGDGLIRGQEQCDDGSNFDSYQNCINCKYGCDSFCRNCLFGVCQSCNEGYYLNEKSICTEQCQNKSLKSIINQEYIYRELMCFRQVFQCDKGWNFDHLLQECQPICGDGLIMGYEECDYGSNFNHFANCVNCKFQCNSDCINCKWGICILCKQGYYLNNNNICQQQPQQISSEIQDFNYIKIVQEYLPIILFNCEVGWRFDSIKQKCQPICGDGLIKGFEQCDYGINHNMQNNCINCQYQCDNYCINCQFGECKECNEGYYLNQNNICKQEQCQQLQLTTYISEYNDYINQNQKQSCIQPILNCEEGWDFEPIIQQCQPICGDGLIRGHEQCDYGSESNSQDICDNCQFVCDNFEDCLFCSDVICITCKKGFDLIYGQCQPICGDNIVIEKYEQCDDGNDIEYDGCFDCQYQCIKDCNICKNGQCLLKCEEGYELQNDKCVSICGDMIKTKDEECDDGNDEPFDGCFECYFSCPLNCKTCLLDLCLECNQFYELDDNQCNTVINCGDGQIDFNEACDDQNSISNDGCRNCQIEDDWICTQYDLNQPTQCEYQKGVHASLTYLNMTENTQFVELKFSDKITVIGFQTLSETLHYTLIDISQDKYVINLIELTEEHYIFQIQINKLLTEAPYFLVKISEQVISQFDRPIYQNEHMLRLRFPKYLTQNQKEQAYMLLNLNKIILYSLVGFVGISLLFGILDPFLEIISILQYQQHLRYLNFSFPLNLEIYFTLNDLLDITPLTEFLNIEFLMNIFQIPINYKQSIGKFQEYEVNSDLISNLQAQFIQTFLTLIIALFITQKYTNELIYKKLFSSKFFYFASLLALQLSPNIVFYLCLGVCQVTKMILALKNMVSEDGINQIIYVNAWDVIFKVFLYLSSIKNEQTFTNRDYAEIFVSILLIGFYFQLLFQTLFSSAKKRQCQTKKELQVIKEQQFFGFNIMRQLIFLFVLVQFQDQPILQSLTISLISIFYTILLIYFRKIQITVNFYTNVIVEISVTLFTLSAAGYGQDFSNFFDEKYKILSGWIQIIMLSLGLQFYFDIFSSQSCNQICSKQI